MCRDTFRRFSTSGLGAQKQNGKQRQLARSSSPKAKDDHMKPNGSKTAAFKPKVEQRSESGYHDRATERRKGADSGFIKFEAISEKFEKQIATEDKAMIEERRNYLGGNAEHSCKGRDFGPLEQATDRSAPSEAAQDAKEVEEAFRKTSAVDCHSGPLPSERGAKKRTREDIVEEVKNKRVKSESEGANMKSELDPEPVEGKAMEEAKPMVEFKPVGGRNPIASTSKKGKNDEKEVKKEAPCGSRTTHDSGVGIIYIDYSTDSISDDDKGREDIFDEGEYAAAGFAHLSVEADRSEESSREDSVGLDGFITQHQASVPMRPIRGTKATVPKSGITRKMHPPAKNAKQQVAAAFPAETVRNEESNSRVEGRVIRSRGTSQNSSSSSNIQLAASRVAGRRQKTTAPCQWLAARPCERCAHHRAACYIKKEDRTCCRCQRRKVGCTLASKGSGKGRKVKLEAEEVRRKEEEERKKKEREEELEAIQSAIRENGAGPVNLASAVGGSEFDLVAAVREAERLRALMTTNFIGFMKDSLMLRDVLGKLLAYTKEFTPASTQQTVDVVEGKGREESEDENEDKDKENKGMVEVLIVDE